MTAPVQIGRKSAAKSTAFCVAELHGPDGVLYLDGNGKITAGNGTLAEPKPNALSLPAGNSDDRRQWCPGSTATCRASCYTHALEDAQPEIAAMYVNNGRMIRDVILADEATGAEWALRLADWITANAPHGFRWHVSGDVINAGHALWISLVARLAPRVQFWIYTRSLFALPLLVADNLTVNVSCDVDNFAEALVAWQACRDFKRPVRLCYMTTDGTVPAELPAGSVIFPDYPMRGVGATPDEMRKGSAFWRGLDTIQRAGVCPVDFYGKSELLRCGPCRRCIDTPK